MSIASAVQRDERTVSVENASFRWAYEVLSYGLLLEVAYRGYVRREAAWDLLALVFLSGAVATIYQALHRAVGTQRVFAGVLAMGLAAVVAAVVVLLVRQ